MPADPNVLLARQVQVPTSHSMAGHPSGGMISPTRSRADLGEVVNIRRDVASMAAKVRGDVEIEAQKLEMELQVSRMQQTLAAVNGHLEEEQKSTEKVRREAAEERERLLAEVNSRDEAIQTAVQEREELQRELEALKNRIDEQRREFNEEKRVLNDHFVRVGHEHRMTIERLEEAEAETKDLQEKNTVLKDWLDRGTEECRRVAEENETTKKILQQTAGNWEEDHQTLSNRLTTLESEYKTAVHERGALAVNLSAARTRVLEDSRNLYNVVPILKNLTRKCTVIESALSSSSTDPLVALSEEPDVSREPPKFDQETMPASSSHHIRVSANELYDAFRTVHRTAYRVLKQWQEDRNLASGLPGKIQTAQSEATVLRDSNDRLKLKLNELRGELEKWRQKAMMLESAQGASSMPMTRLEKQQLMQAQTVAATLHREKEQLNKEVRNLQKENADLRTNYNTAEIENTVMKEEIQRLRMQVSRQASQFDAFRVLPPLH